MCHHKKTTLAFQIMRLDNRNAITSSDLARYEYITSPVLTKLSKLSKLGQVDALEHEMVHRMLSEPQSDRYWNDAACKGPEGPSGQYQGNTSTTPVVGRPLNRTTSMRDEKHMVMVRAMAVGLVGACLSMEQVVRSLL